MGGRHPQNGTIFHGTANRCNRKNLPVKNLTFSWLKLQFHSFDRNAAITHPGFTIRTCFTVASRNGQQGHGKNFGHPRCFRVPFETKLIGQRFVIWNRFSPRWTRENSRASIVKTLANVSFLRRLGKGERKIDAGIFSFPLFFFNFCALSKERYDRCKENRIE